MEHPLQEVVVWRQALKGPSVQVDLPNGHRGPSLDGRVDVAKIPLVGGQLAVGVHVPLSTQQQEL